MNAALAPYPVQIEIPVGFGDMDAYGHVNNTRYFRWFEDVRFEAFTRASMTEVQERTGLGPILAKTQCIFKAPVTYPDTIRAGVRVTAIDADRFTMEHCLVSVASGAVVAEGDARIVIVDYRNGGKAPIPNEVRTVLESLRGPGEA